MAETTVREIKPLIDTEDEIALVERMKAGREKIIRELRKVIVGQDDVIQEVLIALFAGGHSLITGVPGLAKTLLIKTIADITQLRFGRIQFTPDLMPADVIGTEVVEEDPRHGAAVLKFVKGPIFANILLADEINRTPPKTQSALLEAMEEQQVTAGGVTYKMDSPFFVLATQNPIELEGTYPLPEAQLDRFMFKIMIDYLPEDEEIAVVNNTTGVASMAVEPLLARPGYPRFPAYCPASAGRRRGHAFCRAPCGCQPAGKQCCTGFRPKVGQLGCRAAGLPVSDSGG